MDAAEKIELASSMRIILHVLESRGHEVGQVSMSNRESSSFGLALHPGGSGPEREPAGSVSSRNDVVVVIDTCQV